MFGTPDKILALVVDILPETITTRFWRSSEIEDITCPRVDTNFIFECSTQHQGYFSNFPKISEHFPKISEDFSKFSERCPKFIRTFPIIFRKFPKMSEDCRRLPNVSEQSSKMFRSHRNEFRFVPQLNLVNVIAHTTSLLSSHVNKFIFTREDIMFVWVIAWAE